jgi:hypothetical protein
MRVSSFFALALAGLVGAGAVLLAGTLVSPASVSRAPVASTDGPTRADSASLVASVEELSRATDELLLRVSALESAPRAAAATRAPLQADAAEGEADEAERQAASLMRSLTGEGPLSPVFVARVEEALEEIRVAEELERDNERRLAAAERIDDRLSQVAVELGLSSYQVDELRAIMTEQDERRSELWDTLREGTGDRFSMRAEMVALREETTSALGEVLDPDQLQRFQAAMGGFGFGGASGRPGAASAGGDAGAGGAGGGRRLQPQAPSGGGGGGAIGGGGGGGLLRGGDG